MTTDSSPAAGHEPNAGASSHHEMLAVIMHAHAAQSESGRANIKRTAKRIGLSTGIAQSLRMDPRRRLLKSELVASLTTEYRKIAGMPWADSHEDLAQDVRHKLGDDGDPPAIEDIRRYLLPLAYNRWAPLALDAAVAAQHRAAYGTLAARVLFDGAFKLHNIIATGDANDPVAINREDIIAKGFDVIDALKDLVIRPTAYEELYATRKTREKDIGFRRLRTRILNDWVAWHGMLMHPSPEQFVNFCKQAISYGLIDQLQEMSKIIPGDISWLNNAFNILMFAGDWYRTVHVGIELLGKFPKMLETTILGIKPIVQDPSVWPGIAAICVLKEFHELDAIRGKLEERETSGLRKMMTAVDKMKLLIEANPNIDYLTLSNVGVNN